MNTLQNQKFEEVFKKNQKFFIKVIREKISCSYRDAEDILMQAMYKVLAVKNPVKHPKAYIMAAISSTCIDVFRNEERSIKVTEDDISRCQNILKVIVPKGKENIKSEIRDALMEIKSQVTNREMRFLMYLSHPNNTVYDAQVDMDFTSKEFKKLKAKLIDTDFLKPT